MYDFAVVGVGPAGTRFTRCAVDAGYNVLALEKGEVRAPLACSGHVSTGIREYVPGEARNRLLQNRIYGANSRVGGPNSKVYLFYEQNEVSNVIDYVELNRILADCARDAGADVREGHTVTVVKELDDCIQLTVSVAGEVGTVQFETRMVVRCDGPTSCVRWALDLPEPSETLHGVLTFDPDPDNDDFVDVHLAVPCSFTWCIPRGDAGVEYDLTAPSGAEVNEMFDALMDTYDVEAERFYSGAVPVGPPDRTITWRAFLVGDAAVQAKPFTGGGILYGMTTADIAASTIDSNDPETLSTYKSVWRDELSREIRLGHLMRRCYFSPKWLQRAGLQSLPGEVGVHMDKLSSFFSHERLRKLL